MHVGQSANVQCPTESEFEIWSAELKGRQFFTSEIYNTMWAYVTNLKNVSET